MKSMDRTELDQRLSRMSTMWTMVLQAHGDEADSAAEALAGLAQRYSGVVYRYLLGAVRDPDTAAELSQEFALRILRGTFRQADPSHGRFRDYIKTALIHLVNDYHRSRRQRPGPLASDLPDPCLPDDDPGFDTQWREERTVRTCTTSGDRYGRSAAVTRPLYRRSKSLRHR
jgi:RNA polymerase sigma-70 factor (ECF subfamily)